MEELQERIKWLEHGLKTIQDKIASKGIIHIKEKEVGDILDTTVAFLDGEPTTADEYNGSDCMVTYVNKENNIVGKRITFN
tara:strand:+ start:93 stop:335 length:243 start_codon:yes stop_codon:yes gene_type:complete